MGTTRQILLGTLLPFLATACGSEPRQPAPAEQNAPAALAIEPALADPAGEADAAVFFGPVQVGQSRAETVLVRNVGGAATEVELGSVEPPFSLAAYGSAQLAPGDALELELRFTPEEARGDESILTLAAGGERISIRLAGSGTPAPPGSCVLHVATRTLRWFGVGVGYEAVREPYLSNTGAAPCEVSLAVEGDGFSVESGAVTVPPHEAIAVPVRWTPGATGTTTGLLEVRLGEESWSVPLEGEAVASCLALSTATIDFGNAVHGCATTERSVTATNLCTHDIELTDVRIAGPAAPDGAAVFSIRMRPMIPGTILGLGHSASFALAFYPQELGTETGTFHLAEGNGAEHSVELRGNGDLPPLVTDHFSQPEAPEVDRLFVLDDGPGMDARLPTVRQWAEELAAFKQTQFVDERWAVTTTSRIATAGCAGSGADGRFVPVDGTAPRWLATREATAAELADLFDIEACSTAPNEGFAMAWRALSELATVVDDPVHPELNDGNASFLREDANVEIVFVSPRADASGEEVADWFDRFASIKGSRNPNMLAIWATIPGEACGTSFAGSRHWDLAAQANGVVADLCAPETWGSAYQRVGGTGFPYKTRFFLTGAPMSSEDDAGLEVRVNDVLVPPLADDGSRRWTFTRDVTAVDFEPQHAPPEGSSISITYRPRCF
ncbi:choice-of-anchor D domain-containing protein [Vulgatibacter sp.]|uniref:choice-of-anchor D domain-containing protein n=1 Tax=Vulgatibacter sp. TaxID=1971226 RepID=UPI0035639142